MNFIIKNLRSLLEIIQDVETFPDVAMNLVLKTFS